ncbi:MAG: hypothetical protein JSU87_15255 [Gemmatimonadota bacterium]|nr:MAG: hypothetical protein JSU87_15255 [Gemmatimonadota bacterium]
MTKRRSLTSLIPTARGSPRRYLVVRSTFMSMFIVLGLIRYLLNPPVRPLVLVVMATWCAMVALFFVAEPRKAGSGCYPLLLHLAFFAYEASTVIIVMQLLGGSGWLTILFLLYPTLELNLLHPGPVGLTGSLIAALSVALVVLAEATGWLLHDPFYSVAHPLYTESSYVLAVFAVALACLVGFPALVEGFRRAQHSEAWPRRD